MGLGSRRRSLENLAFSCACALVGLVATFSLSLVDRLEERRDVEVLSRFAQAGDKILRSGHSISQGFKLYSWKNGGGIHFGSLLPMGEPGYVALMAVAFSSDAELETINFLASPVPGHIAENDSVLSGFLGDSFEASENTRPKDPMIGPTSGQAETFARDCRADLRAIASTIRHLGKGAKP